MSDKYPILEFDDTREAFIEPSKIIKPLGNMPERVVFCFFQDSIKRLVDESQASIIHHLGSEIGKNPIYEYQNGSQSVAIIHPGMGGPLAAGFLEEAIALGGRKFIACGGAGALDKRVTVGHVIVPESAIRDEGTSYHYLPPSREADAHPEAVKAIVKTLEKHSVPYDVGKTWTTDAIYRETPKRIQQRRDEGALTVEMEASTFFAVAEFRDVMFGQLLYGGDDVSGDIWDSRGWHKETGIRDKLLTLAIESVLEL